jgi:sugar-specific transcriptional regulator TrmB
MNLLSLLQSIGLTKTEAEVYLANLQMGPSSAIQLGQKVGTTRQLIYNLLPDLIERGFIKQVTIGKRNFYQAVDPEILEDKVAILQRQIATAIPLLKEQQSGSNAVPHITVYDNPLSMREWYRGFMRDVKAGEEKLVYSTETGWFDLDQEFYRSFADFQIKKKVKNRIIAPDTAEVREIAKSVTKDSAFTFDYRFTPEKWLGEGAKWIWRNQIIHLTVRGKATNLIVLESAELASIERIAFDRVWESLD